MGGWGGGESLWDISCIVFLYSFYNYLSFLLASTFAKGHKVQEKKSSLPLFFSLTSQI